MRRLARAWIMWAAVLAGTLGGLLIVALFGRDFGQITRAGLQHWLLLAAVVLAATSLVAAPCIIFLQSAWQQRLDEFKNSIRDGAIKAYLEEFWERRLDDRPEAREHPAAAEALFNDIYVAQYGRRAFIAPIVLLLAVTLVAAILTVQTGIDACVAGKCIGGGAVQGRFAPLGDIALPRASAAAIGGAYLFTIGDMIARVRWRTLTGADLCGYSLRLVLAIPLGLAFTQLAADNVAALVAFGLGAFPMDSLLKLLRRFTTKSVGAEEEKQEPDQLVQLDGVTVAISTQLAAEGVDSIDELVGTDPVLLSVRSGVPFSSLLRFASQAVVRIHFGERATQLVPIALGNAYLVSAFVTDYDAHREGTAQRLADAVAQLRKDATATVPCEQTVAAGFRAIAAHGYTRFLIAVADA